MPCRPHCKDTVNHCQISAEFGAILWPVQSGILLNYCAIFHPKLAPWTILTGAKVHYRRGGCRSFPSPRKRTVATPMTIPARSAAAQSWRLVNLGDTVTWKVTGGALFWTMTGVAGGLLHAGGGPGTGEWSNRLIGTGPACLGGAT